MHALKAVPTQEYNMTTDTSIYSASQLNATSSLLQNQGLSVNANMAAALNAYTTTLFVPLVKTVAIVGAGGSVQAGSPPGATPAIMTPEIASQLLTLGATTCPALGDSIPAAYSAKWPAVLMSSLVGNIANTYMGNGDLSKFAQAFSTASSYSGTTNQVINSAVNSQTYLG